MPLTANDLLDAARQLPPEDQQWLLRELLHEEEATWQKEVGEPEPGYDQWFRTKVEESLVDDSPGISHDQVVKEMAEFLSTARSGRKLKASA